MDESKRLETLVEVDEDQHIIQSPAVGYYSAAPKTGDILTSGAFIGKLKILTTTHDLYLSGENYGRVIIDEECDHVRVVEYGQELFRLNPNKNLADGEKELTGPGGTNGEDAAEGGHVVTAFTTGIFYAKPSPDSPPFVSVGQEIEKGKALGLIEIMKTFNHIVFHGTDDSDTGTIKKIMVKDGQEVKSGQPLFIIE
ncbi:MAG: biotin/lipoyl-binding protein [bacterium]|nr:biotin/lipoyl-binding protein [bacterium]